MVKETIVLAIGGNSLILDPKNVTVPAQYEAAYETALHLVPLLKEGHNLAIVHGNGPQVGFILRRAEIAKPFLHMVPLDSCVADTQGALGYGIQTALRNALVEAGTARSVCTVVTEVIVDKDDPSFKNPSKPIGSFMEAEEAEEHRNTDGWSVVEDAGRGWRRVVPSPIPREIMELDVIRTLVTSGTVAVAAGGGGIPVIQNTDGTCTGIEAVIDKDLAASLLARQLNADRFIISTAVEKVYLNFGTPDQKALETVTIAEAEEYIRAGHFAPGSMLPKIEAAVAFVQATGKEAVITNPPNLSRAVAGDAGTHIVP
ncbi:MAG: carbamate kinase [Spirochaeta sp.]|jgi:carbamate kinase|nr:carbamate kinase [Spirochaeta sp.]